MRVGFLHSIIRKEEKLLLGEFRKRSEVELIKIDDRQQFFDLHKNAFDLDVVVERSVNHSRAMHALKIFTDHGVPTVNTPEVAEVCGSKFLTTQALIKAGVPTPRCFLAFTPESALAAMDQLGYPCVIKPPKPSWNTSRSWEATITPFFISRNTWKKRAKTSAALSLGVSA
jgi:[lysine-biosynthesis-protein LysW]--L-2-aminoadipate ligase